MAAVPWMMEFKVQARPMSRNECGYKIEIDQGSLRTTALGQKNKSVAAHLGYKCSLDKTVAPCLCTLAGWLSRHILRQMSGFLGRHIWGFLHFQWSWVLKRDSEVVRWTARKLGSPHRWYNNFQRHADVEVWFVGWPQSFKGPEYTGV